MRPLTIDLPDDLVERLKPVADRMATVLERGLREVNATGPGFGGVTDVMEFFAGLPAPEEVLALRPSARVEHRVRELLDRSRTAGLSAEEEREWAQYEFIEHLVRKAKARAAALTQRSPA
jgi:hypothetical protein